MPPSWSQQCSRKAMTSMDKFKRAVAITERDEVGVPDQSWYQKVRHMEPISETVSCCVSGKELLEEDCQAGGKWEQHIEDENRRKTAGTNPAEVIRPGHALRIEIAKYFRGQLREDYPPVFYDDDEYSEDEHEVDASSLDEDSGSEGNEQGVHDSPEATHNACEPNGDKFQVDTSSTSSSEAGIAADDLDAEQERLAAVFADFPTCINRIKHLTSIDDEQYGLLAIIKDAAWSQVSGESLTTRVRQWIADFTSE